MRSESTLFKFQASNPSSTSHTVLERRTARTHTPKAHSLSGIITSLSQLQTDSPIPSPVTISTPTFQIPIIRKPKPVGICPGSEVE